MTATIPTNKADAVLAKLMKLFGPPPLLRNESLDDFKKVFAELFAAVMPEDFLTEERVYRLAIETWCAYRLMRYEALIIDGQEKNQRLRSAEESKRKNIAVGMEEIREDYPGLPTTDPQYVSAVTELKTLAFKEYQRQINARPTDMGYIEAWPKDNDLLKEIRSLLSQTHKRCDDLRCQISEYQLASSKRLRKDPAVFIEEAVSQLDTSPGAVPEISPQARVKTSTSST
jgi:hypothetical protein